MTTTKVEFQDSIRDEILLSLEQFGRKHLSDPKDDVTRLWNHIYNELNDGIRGKHFSKRVNKFQKDMVSPFFELEFVSGKKVLVKTIRKYAVHLRCIPIEKKAIAEIIKELDLVLQYYHLKIVEPETYKHVYQSEKTYYVVYKKGVNL